MMESLKGIKVAAVAMYEHVLTDARGWTNREMEGRGTYIPFRIKLLSSGTTSPLQTINHVAILCLKLLNTYRHFCMGYSIIYTSCNEASLA